ncbi:hypothetical protein BS78_K249000 [Paspalum vaginatum]|uniref:RWP-RK domain-containing protein n=1 Tax=Paspalum vaginatum TaxID=158149 RepID=A0A9W8CCE9_9POAL|nr:hypothetical protein BS78_K249000 [Paspalum vaginatum]
MSSDEVYDADGDVGRYLQTPLPESNLFAMPDDEPVETHVGAPPQNVPLAVQSSPCGFPDPQQARQGRSDDPMPSFEATLDESAVLPNIGAMSLYDCDDDQLMTNDWDDDWVEALSKIADDAGNNNTNGSAVAEDTVSPCPVAEDLNFVPFVRGQLDCSKCRSVREVLHESANHKLYFIVHVAESGTFQHAIIDRLYIDADGQTILNELMFHDLSQHTYEWVHNFIANSVEVLKNDARVGPEAPQPPVTRAEENITNVNADGMLNSDNLPGLATPAVLESSQQRQRIAQTTMQDIMSCMHMSSEDAAKQLKISTTSLKRLCRKNNTDRWPARTINSLENKIKKLEQAAQKNVGTIGLLAIKEIGQAQAVQENKHKDGAGSSGSK